MVDRLLRALLPEEDRVLTAERASERRGSRTRSPRAAARFRPRSRSSRSAIARNEVLRARRERRLGHPEVAGGVVLRLARWRPSARRRRRSCPCRPRSRSAASASTSGHRVASSAWIRMYCAKQRASRAGRDRLVRDVHVGMRHVGQPGLLASAAIPVGVMSAEPTICSFLMLLLTVERPLTPMYDRRDAERDQDDCCDIASDFKCLAHSSAPFVLRTVASTLRAGCDRAIGAAAEPACGDAAYRVSEYAYSGRAGHRLQHDRLGGRVREHPGELLLGEAAVAVRGRRRDDPVEAARPPRGA